MPKGLPQISAKILLAEDSVVNQEIALATLEFFGCEVNISSDGRGAVESWRNGIFDLILMDCIMPEMDGYEATRQIRALEAETGHIPIIAISANSDRSVREKSLQAGMNDLLGKPYTTQELYDIIRKWLK